ncbi:proprotein convertase subtilisin kexin type 9 preproprotein [Nannochloropsis gaditana CCMP526]|uniref:proprotein convertase subtilisin kexin type 9 preproprotein n=1 Tax=Nannochloropsis gaditana (strain CCMP526) TaxID=1093141 RepID=UPI00029F786C|nr:proprotein convertase subtilisin kexin type 9 preproprotein [Nannochloropsis gaditana CCMP526]EKU23177.1 proprotein convertase subtilisin kexin type 9 preproprotein [Nannochloropsis gaditana CCMP526]|eukprot:XP_005852656.1 proprotein convertase subtilisin kexin type 9 preproprotein [Nannochloropsis gaditana CCMP526]
MSTPKNAMERCRLISVTRSILSFLLLLCRLLPTVCIYEKYDTIDNGRFFILPGKQLSTASIDTGRMRLKPIQDVGRQFLLALDDTACPPSPGRLGKKTCQEVAAASLSAANCSDVASYESLQMVSAVCFGPMDSSPFHAEESLRGKLAALPFVRGVTADLQVRGPFQQRAVTDEELTAAVAEAEARGKRVDIIDNGPIRAFSTGAAKSLYKFGQRMTATPAPTIVPATGTAPPMNASANTTAAGSGSTGTNRGVVPPPTPISSDAPTARTGDSTPASPGSSPSGADPSPANVSWLAPDDINWGLDRINQLGLDLDRDTRTCHSRGKGVIIFSVDTGCRTSHQEFGGRARTESVRLPDSGLQDPEPYAATGGADDHGHGTHTAAVAAGASVGVAPEAEIRCIKALDQNGVGRLAHTVAALEMIAAARLATPSTPMVASLSISAPADAAMDAAVARLQALGVVVVVAAGNEGRWVEKYSPAGEPSAITVGATQPPSGGKLFLFNREKGDSREAYSNQGTAVDIYAPGTNIFSAGIENDQAYGYRTGTSQAAPFVTGAIACVLGDALAANGPVACRSSSSLLEALINPNIEVKHRTRGPQSFGDNKRPFLYVPPGAKYDLRCPLPSGLVGAILYAG